MSTRLAIVTTHPIQYNAPLFQMLAQQDNLCLKVFYSWGQSKEKVYDPGFGKAISWDIPLLDGYPYEFVENIASKPGSNHFWGIQTPFLIRKIKAFQPTVILIFGWSFYSHLQVMRYFKRKTPVWFRGDSNLLDEAPGWTVKKILRRVLLKWVYSYVDRAWYVGTANRRYYEKHGLMPTQLSFAPHAIDNQRFEAGALEKENQAAKWRTDLSIPEEATVFLFVGKLESKKNPELLLQAFVTLNNLNAFLIFVGDGQESQKLKGMAEGNNRIIFLGFQNQSLMPTIYRLGNVLVLPSRGPGETWGLAVNEAFACSRPAIVSDKVGCGQDLILQQQTGWIFHLHQENGLVKALNQALQQGSAGLSRMGQQAQQLITNWSYIQTVDAINQALTHAH